MRYNLFGHSTAFLSSTANRYIGPMNGQSRVVVTTGPTSSVPNIDIPLPQDVTFEKIIIKLTSAPGSGKSYTFTLQVNGSSTGVVITIADTATVGTWTGTHACSEGDTVRLLAAPSGTPTSTLFSMSTTVSASGYHLSIATLAITSSNQAYNLVGQGVTTLGSYEIVAIKMPCAGTFSKLHGFSSVTVGAGHSLSFTMYKNGVSTALTTTVNTGDTNNIDSTNSVSVAIGDVIHVQTANSGYINNPSFGLLFTPDTSGQYFVQSAREDTPSTTATEHGSVTGIINYDPTETNAFIKTIMGAVRIKEMSTVITAPGTGKSRAVTLREDGADTAVTYTISNAETTGTISPDFDTQEESLYNLKFVPSGTPSATYAPTVFLLEEIPTAVDSNSGYLFLFGG